MCLRNWPHRGLIALVSALGAAAPAPSRADDAPKGPIVAEVGSSKARVAYWLEPSLRRVYPGTRPGTAALDLIAARNGKIAFQACIRNNSDRAVGFDCAVVGADDLKPLVRRVGYVPLTHLTDNTPADELEGVGHVPGFVPDPLYPEPRALLGPHESQSLWITLNVPADAKPGTRVLHARLTPWGGTKHADLPVKLEISRLVVQPRHDFHVIHWWRGEATWDYYHTGMFDERWWKLTHDQLKNMLEHGSDVVYVPIFFDRRETFKRPCQLLGVEEPSPGQYRFDWSRIKQFTDMAKRIGFKRFEWSHLWIYWGVKNPVRIYKRKPGEGHVMLWPPDTGATSETYLNFLRQFLPEFHQFLTAEGLLEDSYFHLSDEPGSDEHVANYKKARQVLRELAPWMKVMDALSDIRYGKEGLTDIPIPMVNAAQAYIDAGIPHWVYYCCAPKGAWVNRFMDTPLPKIRMAGWLFYKQGAQGFLHWGFNYWHLMESEQIGDPFHDASNGSWPGIPYGDPFVIYPGKDGPLDSIRWEVFAESLQDYAILQTAGIKRDGPLLADLKTYADFPKTEAWIRSALEEILRAPETAAQR